MRNKIYRKKGLGIMTIAMMMLCTVVMVIPTNVVAIGKWGGIYIEGDLVLYGGSHSLADGNVVNGSYITGTPGCTFEWTIDDENWRDIVNVTYSAGKYEFDFQIGNADLQPPGTLWIAVTEGGLDKEWHCTYT